MRLYLDEDSVETVLVKLLRRAGHDVRLATEAETTGTSDALQFAHAIGDDRVILTRNYRHFEDLHGLVLRARGHHPGIITVRRDNDPTRDMTARGVVTAIGNLLRTGVPLADSFHVLNHWR